MTGWTGILQGEEGHKTVRETVLPTNAYGGHSGLYHVGHKPAPVLNALCWSYARRKFFERANVKDTARKGRSAAEEMISSIGLEAVKRFDAIFDVERETPA